MRIKEKWERGLGIGEREIWEWEKEDRKRSLREREILEWESGGVREGVGSERKIVEREGWGLKRGRGRERERVGIDRDVRESAIERICMYWIYTNRNTSCLCGTFTLKQKGL